MFYHNATTVSETTTRCPFLHCKTFSCQHEPETPAIGNSIPYMLLEAQLQYSELVSPSSLLYSWCTYVVHKMQTGPLPAIRAYYHLPLMAYLAW